MHGAIRAAGFSVMTMFVSCGVGAQDLDARAGQVTLDADTPTHVSAPRCDLRLDPPVKAVSTSPVRPTTSRPSDDAKRLNKEVL